MARLSTAMVLERTSKEPEPTYKFVQNATDGLAAQKAALKLAEQFPGRVFIPAALWKAVMAEEVRKVTFINPDDPEGKMDDDDSEVVAEKKPAKQEAKPEVKVEAKPEVKVEVKPEVKVEAKPEVKVEAKPVVKDDPVKSNVSLAEPAKAEPTAPKPVSKPVVKPVAATPPKAADPASSAFGELFGNDSPEPDSFVNEDDDDDSASKKEEDDVPSLF